MEKVEKSDAEWRALLTDEQYRITRQGGTEQTLGEDVHDGPRLGSMGAGLAGLRVTGTSAPGVNPAAVIAESHSVRRTSNSARPGASSVISAPPARGMASGSTRSSTMTGPL